MPSLHRIVKYAIVALLVGLSGYATYRVLDHHLYFDIELVAPGSGPCRPAGELLTYYTPGAGTPKAATKSVSRCDPPVLHGQQHADSILVLNSGDRTLRKVSAQGQTLWVLRASKKIADLRRDGDRFRFILGKRHIALDPDTGQVRLLGDVPAGYRCFDGTLGCAKDAVIDLGGGLRVPAQFPRAAIRDGSLLLVADTFGHQVVGIDGRSGETVLRVDSYFPNDLQMTPQGLVVAEEHANRIVRIDPATGKKEVLYGCAEPPYRNPDISHAAIIAYEESPASRRADGKGHCHGGALFSPNGISVEHDGSMVISDTDNHRVVHINAHGQLIRTLDNLQMPVRAFLVRKRP